MEETLAYRKGGGTIRKNCASTFIGQSALRGEKQKQKKVRRGKGDQDGECVSILGHRTKIQKATEEEREVI